MATYEFNYKNKALDLARFLPLFRSNRHRRFHHPDFTRTDLL
jgi:hypothetical protein